MGSAEPPTQRAVATRWRDRGLLPIPVPAGGKRPVIDGWQDLRLTTDAQLAEHFGRVGNVGGLNGAPSGWKIDGDLDCAEALRLADWLPDTGLIFGRKSNPGSHRYYVSPGLKTTQFRDPVDDAMLGELRSSGSQTLLAGSRHPSGEFYTLERDGAPATVAEGELLRAFGKVMAAALLVRHWPGKGSRHHASLALAGMLLRGGWEEDEAAEFVARVAEEAGDDEWRAREKNVATTARRLAEGEEASGATKLAEQLGEHGRAVVGAAGRWLWLATERPRQTPPESPPQAVPTAVEEWPWPLLRPSALHGIAGDIVRALAPHTEADPAAVLIGLLIEAGNAMGRAPHTWADGARHGTSEFALIVGRTSRARKDTARRRVRPILRAIDEDWSDTRRLNGLGSGEGLILALRDATDEEPGVEDKRALVDEGEFSRVLKVAAREGNLLSEVLRLAWDGEKLRNQVKQRPLVASDPHVSLIGAITLAELRDLADDRSVANGLLNRHLICLVRRSKLLPRGGGDPDLAAPSARLTKAVARARELAKPLRRDAAAECLWARVYRYVGREVPGLAGDLLARAEAHLLRLSLLYSLLDSADAIGEEHLRAAVALWRYVEEGVFHVWGGRTGDQLADRILGLLLGAGEEGLAKADLFNLAGGRHVSAERLNAALGTLLTLGRARMAKEPGTGTKPIERWYGLPATRRADHWDAVLDAGRPLPDLPGMEPGADESDENNTESGAANGEFTEFVPGERGNWANSHFAVPENDPETEDDDGDEPELFG